MDTRNDSGEASRANADQCLKNVDGILTRGFDSIGLLLNARPHLLGDNEVEGGRGEFKVFGQRFGFVLQSEPDHVASFAEGGERTKDDLEFCVDHCALRGFCGVDCRPGRRGYGWETVAVEDPDQKVGNGFTIVLKKNA